MIRSRKAVLEQVQQRATERLAFDLHMEKGWPNRTAEQAALGRPWAHFTQQPHDREDWDELWVECPHCTAEPGETCRTPSGYHTYTHRKRKKLAAQIKWIE